MIDQVEREMLEFAKRFEETVRELNNQLLLRDKEISSLREQLAEKDACEQNIRLAMRKCFDE